MNGKCIDRKIMLVAIQENSIIRRADTGYLIGRLSRNYKYKELVEYVADEPKEAEK